MTQHSKQLDDTRKVMAEYWADGPRSVTPPGHWNLFAQYVSRRDANTLDEDARLYFALNNALLDASITAWDGKRNWDSVRPITAVRWLMRGKTIQAWGGPYQGPSYIKGEDWIPYQPPTDPTPPFAEYTSGHSTFSCAAAEVLTAFTGRGNFEMTVTIPAGSSRTPDRTPDRDPAWGTGQAHHVEVDQLPVRGRAGRQVPPVRRDPLRGLRQPRPRSRRQRRQTSLGQSPHLLQRHRHLTRFRPQRGARRHTVRALASSGVEGAAGSPVAVVWLPGRRAGLELVEKLLTGLTGIRPSNWKQRAPKLSGRSSRLPVGCGTGMAKG
jgi:hypothetical protein